MKSKAFAADVMPFDGTLVVRPQWSTVYSWRYFFIATPIIILVGLPVAYGGSRLFGGREAFLSPLPILLAEAPLVPLMLFALSRMSKVSWIVDGAGIAERRGDRTVRTVSWSDISKLKAYPLGTAIWLSTGKRRRYGLPAIGRDAAIIESLWLRHRSVPVS